MKKLKVMLSIFAIVTAIGATFATQSKSAGALQGYVYLASENVCNQVQHDCVEPNQTPCEISSGVEIRENSIASASCGRALGRP